MSIRYPFQDRITENKKIVKESLHKCLISIAELKADMLSMQKYEQLVVIRQIEKTTERLAADFELFDRSKNKRIFSNSEIQEKLSKILQKLSFAELEKFCTKDHSKTVFDINYPLLLRVPLHYSEEKKSEAIKDDKGRNRWSWKFGFEKDNYVFAITTQWFEWNDKYVEQWLKKQKQ